MKMNNKSIFAATFFFGLTLTLGQIHSGVFAQESTDSATTVDPETVKENIKKRIQEVVTEGQNVLGLQTAIKGWTGQIETITTDTITLTSEDQTRLVAINTDTAIVRAGKDAKLADLSIGDFVIAMGSPDSNGILNTLRLVASDEEPDKPKQRVIYGPITEINIKKNTLMVDSGEGTNTLTLSKTSKLTENLPEESFKIDLLNSGDEAIIIYTVDDKDPSLFNLVRLHRTKAVPTPSPSPEEE